MGMTREETITKEECLAFYKELANLASARFVPYYKMAIEALEQKPCEDLCKTCDTKGCIFQFGIKRKKCDFYTPKKRGMSDEQIRTVIGALTCEDAISRAYIEPFVEELENICINGDEHVLDILSNIKNAPSVTPQPFINKPCVSEGVCREDKIQVLDKIKEEIKDNTYFINETTEKEGIDFETVEKIIDKYKAESEVNNG